MEFFCPVIDIHEQEIIEQKILDKIVLIKSFLICYQKVLNLKTGNFTHHIDIVAVSAGKKKIFQLMFIKYFKKLKSVHNLTVRRRLRKRLGWLGISVRLRKSRREYLSLQIDNAQIYPGNTL